MHLPHKVRIPHKYCYNRQDMLSNCVTPEKNCNSNCMDNSNKLFLAAGTISVIERTVPTFFMKLTSPKIIYR